MAWKRREENEDRTGAGGEEPRREEPVVDVEYTERPEEGAAGDEGSTPPPPPPPERRGVSMPRMILGVFIVLVGLSILVEETDILRFIFPVALMVFGLIKIFGTRSSSSRILGTIIVFLGFMFLVEAWSLWPIIIILLGLNILWKSMGRESMRRSGRTMSGSAFVKDFVLFGGSERVIDSPSFEGGDVSAVFGGVELDLRRADIQPDREAVIDVFVMFGSAEFTVPPGWEVSQEATAIFGAVEDQTRSAVSGPLAGERTRRLVIRGYALFGGIEIKN